MAIAVDTFAELHCVHTERDDDMALTFDKHTTTYANGDRCVDYEFTVADMDTEESQSIMLSAAQMRTLCHEMLVEWDDEGPCVQTIAQRRQDHIGILRAVESQPFFYDALLGGRYVRDIISGDYHQRHDFRAMLRSYFDLHTETAGNTLVLYASADRGERRACIVVSPDAGQQASPSAVKYARRGPCLVQVFEAGADDGDVEVAGTSPANWVETQGRVLRC